MTRLCVQLEKAAPGRRHRVELGDQPHATEEGLVMAASRKTPTPASTVFDRALELQELRRAAEAYASRHGDVGSVRYRAAWLRFRQRVQSIDDLQRMRAKAARIKPRRDPPTSPAKQAARPRHVDVPATGQDRTAPGDTGRGLKMHSARSWREKPPGRVLSRDGNSS